MTSLPLKRLNPNFTHAQETIHTLRTLCVRGCPNAHPQQALQRKLQPGNLLTCQLRNHWAGLCREWPFDRHHCGFCGLCVLLALLVRLWLFSLGGILQSETRHHVQQWVPSMRSASVASELRSAARIRDIKSSSPLPASLSSHATNTIFLCRPSSSAAPTLSGCPRVLQSFRLCFQAQHFGQKGRQVVILSGKARA